MIESGFFTEGGSRLSGVVGQGLVSDEAEYQDNMMRVHGKGEKDRWENSCDDGFVDSKKAWMAWLRWERAAWETRLVGQPGYRSCTFQARVRHLNVKDFYPQCDGSHRTVLSRRERLICIIIWAPVRSVDSVGRKPSFSFCDNSCSVWLWHLVLLLLIITCSLWVQTKYKQVTKWSKIWFEK